METVKQVCRNLWRWLHPEPGVPMLVLMQQSEPNIWPYYGKAADVIAEKGLTVSATSRVNHILQHWKLVQYDLRRHRKYVAELERDATFLRPYIQGSPLGDRCRTVRGSRKITELDIEGGVLDLGPRAGRGKSNPT